MSLRATTMVLLLLIIGVLSGVVAGQEKKNRSTLLIRRRPSGTVVGQLRAVQGVQITAWQGRWARVRVEGWIRVRD